MDPESDKHLVEVGDDEDVPLSPVAVDAAEVLGEVHHGEDVIPGLEDALHRRVGVGHGLDGRGDHDLLDLRHVDAVQIPVDGELHDLDFISPGLQQYAGVVHLSHI